jgi:hypothetical protein
MSGDVERIEVGETCGYPFLAKPFKVAMLLAMLEDAAVPAAADQTTISET